MHCASAILIDLCSPRNQPSYWALRKAVRFPLNPHIESIHSYLLWRNWRKNMYRVALLWGIALALQVSLSFGQQQLPNDIVTSGKYTIQLCGSQAPELQTALYRL